MRTECRSHWETQEDPWSWLLFLSLFPSLWTPGLILPTQLLHFLLSTLWLCLIAYSFLSLSKFSFFMSAMTFSPATASDSAAQCLPLHTSERGHLVDSAFRTCYILVFRVASQPMAWLVLAQVPTPGPINLVWWGWGQWGGARIWLTETQNPGTTGRAFEKSMGWVGEETSWLLFLYIFFGFRG